MATETPSIARRGQALLELAVGLFAFALVVSVLTTFSTVIVRSLSMLNSLRTGSTVQSESVEVDAFAEKTFTGESSITLRERLVFPLTVL